MHDLGIIFGVERGLMDLRYKALVQNPMHLTLDS